MIISASYKTDIPTFYGPWFMNRLRAGFCRVFNQHNLTAQKIPLNKDVVDGIVFWTKNIGPMIKHLSDVWDLGFPFVIQHTITGYPKIFETSVTEPMNVVKYVRQISERFGRRCVVWRYDPILISDLTSVDWHVANFQMLAEKMSGLTDEVVVSFAHFYQKTNRNLEKLAEENNFLWTDPNLNQKKEILSRFVEIAASFGIQLSLCAQPENMVPGATEAHCIDAQRLTDLTGTPIKAKVKGNRPGCACARSKDVGEYDTCPHGCVYCYAVRNRNLARQRFKQHDPKGEFLFTPTKIRNVTSVSGNQMKLL